MSKEVIIVVFILLTSLFFYIREQKLRGNTRKQQRRQRPTLKEARHLKKVPYPQVRYTNSVQAFARDAGKAKQIGNMGDVIMAPTNDGRIHGGMANLTPGILKARQEAVRNGWVERDDTERRNTEVPDFDNIPADQKSIELDGRRYSMWHRTHVLPFRMALSDGRRIPSIMFAGTAHLNHGDRPDKGYFVSNAEADRRGNLLYGMYRKRNWHLNMNTRKAISVHGNYMPQDTHFSMDDIERLATHIINSYKDKNTPFRYTVWCNYNANNRTAIPDSVEISLINLQRKDVLLSVTLPNEY